jgi:hypothetical protein
MSPFGVKGIFEMLDNDHRIVTSAHIYRLPRNDNAEYV